MTSPTSRSAAQATWNQPVGRILGNPMPASLPLLARLRRLLPQMWCSGRDLVDQTPTQGSRGVDGPPGQHQICGPPPTDAPGDADRPARTGDQAEAQFRQAEHGVGMRSYPAAIGGHLQATAQDLAVHLGTAVAAETACDLVEYQRR